jgi:hypothetical protein
MLGKKKKKKAEYENARSLHFFAQKCHSLLLLSLPITFSLPSTLPCHPLCHELHIATFNNDSKGKSPFQQPVHLSLVLLALTSFTIKLFFFLANPMRWQQI